MISGSGGEPRRIVGNLDCEASFAALSGRPTGPMPQRVLAKIAGAATLLRAFARDGDRLWLPAPVAQDAMADVPGLPRPIVENEPLGRLSSVGGVLAWGETAAVANMRHGKRSVEGACHAHLQDECDSWQIPWRLPLPTPEAAAAVNDRRFSLKLAGELGCRLPKARAIASPRELAAHLRATGIERWVLKAPFSAAGRWRVIHLGGVMTAQTERQIERLFARHGELVFESWMERVADVGVAAAVTPDGLLRISLHRLLVDTAGRFRGLELLAGRDGLDGTWLKSAERALLEGVLERVASALRQAGYSGPFGIDAWRYRLPGDAELLQPLGEINARLTFGWVARALLDRVRDPLGIDPDSRVRLIFGRRSEDRAGVRIVPLLTTARATSASPCDPEIRLEILEPT